MLTADTLFAQAIEIESTEQRAGFLKRACGGNEVLRRELEQLVADHFRAGAFLERPAACFLPEDLQPDCGMRESAGSVIGPYRLLEQIGEGGMGLVFVAEQQHPVRRRVAVKVIKPGMDTREIVARFEAERQALALMDHPNVCRVLDAGETASGLPFFVMELVRGRPLTDYCDGNGLSCRERLELFVAACQAVQHAHTKGIIHRDIKPSNILVTLHDGVPVVKVIDFGVARAVGQRLTEKTIYTRFMQMIGTPLYMSPEQAEMSGLDIDTRSDVYSLGVLLFELLTGVTPFDRERMTSAAFEEVRRILREEDPPAPSARIATLGPMVTTVSAQRGSDPRRLRQLLRGELDWMVMKALEKERGRRYETASAFAADVERYLRDEPVAAGPRSAAYRFRKFARRNRRGLITSAIIGLAALLAAASAAASIGWVVRDRSLRQATLEREVAGALKETKSAYQRDQWRDAQAAVKRAQGLLAGQAASPLSRRIEQWRANLDMVERLDEIRMIRSESNDHIAIQRGYEQAFRLLGIDALNMRPAEAARRVRESEIRPHLVIALDDWMATKLQWEPAGRERLAAVARLADPGSWRNRIRDPAAWHDRDKLEQIAAAPESALLPPSTALLLSNALSRLGSQSPACAVLRAVHLRHPADFWLNRALAGYCGSVGPREDATSFFRAALAARPNDPIAHADLAQHLSKNERHAEAIELLHRALEIKPDYVWGHTLLAGELWRTSCWEEAFAGFNRALALNPDDYRAVVSLANAHRNKGNLDQAVALSQRALTIDPRLPMAYQELGHTLEQKGELDDAEAAFREVCLRVPDTPAYHCDLARFLVRQCAYDKAIAEYGKALACCPANRDAGAEVTQLAATLFNTGNWSRAIRCCRILLQANPQSVDVPRLLADDPIAHAGLAQQLSEQGRHAEAIELLHRALKLKPDYVWGHTLLASELWRTGRWDEAFAGYDRVLALKPDDFWTVVNLANAHRNKGNLDQAAALYQRALTIDPRQPVVYQELGLTLERKGELVEAEAVFREASRRAPAAPAYHCDLARLLDRRQAYDEAIAEYGKALAPDPPYREAGVELVKLATSLFHAGDSMRTIRCCRILLRANPQNVATHRLLADALVARAELLAAIESYRAALKTLPADGDSLDKLVQLGKALRDRGDRVSAMRCYRLALEANSDYAPAQQAMTDLGD